MEQQRKFSRTYHHKTWTGTHYWNLTRDEYVWANTPAGPQRMVKPGVKVVFNRGTYHCTDPRIAQLIEQSREFKKGHVMALPDPKEFSQTHKQEKMRTTAVRRFENPGESEVDRLVNAASQLAEALNKAIGVRAGGAEQISQVPKGAGAMPEYKPAQESEYQPTQQSEFQNIEYDTPMQPSPMIPMSEMPLPEVDGELPDVSGRVGPNTGDTGQGPKGPSKVENQPDGENIQSTPPNPKQFGDGYMKPTLAQQLKNTRVDDGGQKLERFTPPPPTMRGEVGREAQMDELSGLTPIPTMVDDQGGELQPLVPDEKQEMVHPREIQEMGKILRDHDPKPKKDPRTGKRIINCKFCDFHCSGGRTMSTHLQETHPREYAAMQKEKKRRKKRKK